MKTFFYNTSWPRNALTYKPNIMTRNVDGIAIIGNVRYYGNEIPYSKPHLKTGNVESLKPYLEGKKILNDLQFGFRPDRPNHTSIHTMLEYIAVIHE